MSRMIDIDNQLINSDYIVRVTDYEDGRIFVELWDGTSFETRSENWSKISGEDCIRQIYICKNIYASFSHSFDGESDTVRKVGMLALTEAGTFRPMSDDGKFMDYNVETEYLGMHLG